MGWTTSGSALFGAKCTECTQGRLVRESSVAAGSLWRAVRSAVLLADVQDVLMAPPPLACPFRRWLQMFAGCKGKVRRRGGGVGDSSVPPPTSTCAQLSIASNPRALTSGEWSGCEWPRWPRRLSSIRLPCRQTSDSTPRCLRADYEGGGSSTGCRAAKRLPQSSSDQLVACSSIA